MSLHLEFEPHSWYKGFAIKKQDLIAPNGHNHYWYAVTDDGNTYSLVEFEEYTLKELKQRITKYRGK